MKASEKADRLYLEHMLDAAEAILGFTQGGMEEFLESRMVRDAVARNFEIIGEAAKRLSPGTRAAAPQVPWRDVAGFRDVLIHGYDKVIPERVWEAVETHVPPLADALRNLLAPRGP